MYVSAYVCVYVAIFCVTLLFHISVLNLSFFSIYPCIFMAGAGSSCPLSGGETAAVSAYLATSDACPVTETVRFSQTSLTSYQDSLLTQVKKFSSFTDTHNNTRFTPRKHMPSPYISHTRMCSHISDRPSQVSRQVKWHTSVQTSNPATHSSLRALSV